jgi:hypothetical protein
MQPKKEKRKSKTRSGEAEKRSKDKKMFVCSQRWSLVFPALTPGVKRGPKYITKSL